MAGHNSPFADAPQGAIHNVYCVDWVDARQQLRSAGRHLLRHAEGQSDLARAFGNSLQPNLAPYYFLALMDEVAARPEGFASLPEAIVRSHPTAPRAFCIERLLNRLVGVTSEDQKTLVWVGVFRPSGLGGAKPRDEDRAIQSTLAALAHDRLSITERHPYAARYTEARCQLEYWQARSLVQIALQIEAARKSRKLSVAELCSTLSVSHPYINRLFRSEALVSNAELVRIGYRLGIEFSTKCSDGPLRDSKRPTLFAVP